jgi:hypothetical protein
MQKSGFQAAAGSRIATKAQWWVHSSIGSPLSSSRRPAAARLSPASCRAWSIAMRPGRRASARDNTGGEPKVPAYSGGQMPLSTFLADGVRSLLADPELWRAMPEQVRGADVERLLWRKKCEPGAPGLQERGWRDAGS